jgi:hypothetical protein
MADKTARPGSSVDFMINEDGQPLDVPDGSTLRAARPDEETVGATGPTNWWLYGLVALAIVVGILLLLQLLGGGSPGTDVQPGTPVAEQQEPSNVV